MSVSPENHSAEVHPSGRGRPTPFRRFGVLFLGLGSVAILGLAAYVGGWHAWALYHYRAAERSVARSQFGPACDHLEKYLAVWPDSGEAHLLAARTARRADHYQEADRHLKACKRLRWVPEEVELEQALGYVQQGDMSRFEGYFLDCINRGHPESVLILEALAKGSWRTYRLPQALHCLRLWLERDPDNREALYLRGQVQERAHQYNEAVADLRRVLELDGDHDQARLRLAEALVHCHRPGEAVEHFEALLGRQPRSVPVRLGLARCRYALGQPEETRALLDALLAEHPRDAAVLRERGKLALQTGRAGEAEQWLRRALEIEPSEHGLLYDLYLCLQEQGKDAEAKKTLGRLEGLGNDLQRLEGLTKQVARTPRAPQPRYETGVIFLENGQEKEGLRWLESALREAPRHRPTCLTLANYYARKGDAARADHYRRLAEQPALDGAATLTPRP